MEEQLKPIIESYQHFMRNHTKYSRSPSFNMDRHGFHYIHEFDLPVYDNNTTQRSRDAVSGFVKGYGAKCNHYVYYRTVEAWKLPYIFIWRKLD
ncbi:hypothetical protein MUP46_00830 [Patescibacteria group bacterium]|nr:hypothetical protein [Patescibacteria group bacterium]